VRLVVGALPVPFLALKLRTAHRVCFTAWSEWVSAYFVNVGNLEETELRRIPELAVVLAAVAMIRCEREPIAPMNPAPSENRMV
jgi:hypothetical protein